MIKDLLLYFALLLWFVVPSLAQPTIFVEDAEAKQGELVSIPIKLKSFEAIEAMQFTFQWDSEILEFKSFGDFILPNLFESNFGPTVIDSLINVVWLAPATEPQITLDDGSIAFYINFEVIGNPNQNSGLDFPGNPVDNLVIQDYVEFELLDESGTFTVMQPVSIDQLIQSSQIKCTPNPFKDFTIVTFELKEDIKDLNFQIYDATGKEVHKRTQDYFTGHNEILISQNLLNGKGLYFYRLSSTELDFTNTFIFN